MNRIVGILIALFLIKTASSNAPQIIEADPTQYQPNWDSLDSRPIPPWFDDGKIGIFIHWGVFSVPSFGSEWFWADWKGDKEDGQFNTYMKQNYPPDWTYQDFGRDFHAEFYDPDQWATLFKKSGAKYVVLTSKHHEGYTMWPSKYSFSWNAKDVGPNRDLLGDLAKAVRAQNLTFGLYHSLFEWFNPLYLEDKKNGFQSQDFVDTKMLPEMYELVNTYQPWILWSDGDWEANDTYFRSTDFLAWLYNESPVKDVVLVNDRWGIGIPCEHGDFYSCQDRYNPGVLQPHKWENAMTLDKTSWGFRRNANLDEFLTIEELLETLAQTISCGGNLLVNIGPTKEGTIAPIFQERLLQLGDWLSVNGEGIYGSKPWTYQNDTLTSGIWYTTKLPAVYAIILNWPEVGTINLGSVKSLFSTNGTIVTILGTEKPLEYQVNGDSVTITLPDLAVVESKWAWVLKIIPSL